MSLEQKEASSPVALVLGRNEIHNYIQSVDANNFLIIPCGNDPGSDSSLADVVTELMSIKRQSAGIGRAEKLVALIDSLFISDLQSAQSMMSQMGMIAAAKQEVLKSSQWLTTEDLLRLEGFSSSDPAAHPDSWVADGLIFTLRIGGTDFFPFYALDPSRNYLPHKSLVEILRVFSQQKDGWGLSYWFASVNGFLGGKRPLDLLHSHSEFVLAAAKDEVLGVTHG